MSNNSRPPNAMGGFMGFAPASESIDWDVDGPDVMRTTTSTGRLLDWMADARRPQPVMANSLEREGQGEETPRPVKVKPDRYPDRTLTIPKPTLTHDFRMSVTLNPRISIGRTPFGERKWISFTGGSWAATFGQGTVMPGGQDIQIIAPDLSTRIETQYLLRTDDEPPAYIVAKTQGWRTGPPEVLIALADPERADSISPTSYKFRLFVDLETGDERYRDQINCGMWIGSGVRKGVEVIYDAYRVS